MNLLCIKEYNDRNEEKQEELEERISYLEEETISNYDHILELSKEEVEEIKMAYVPIPKDLDKIKTKGCL